MHARAVDEGAARLRALRQDGLGDLGLGAAALAVAVSASLLYPALAVPLLLGGFAAGALGLRALWLRWELIERLAGERDAYSIPEVVAFASREATMERRHCFAAVIRSRLRDGAVPCEARVLVVADELEALASELEDETLALDPVAAVQCMRLVSDVDESPLLNRELAPEEIRSRIRQIRSGLRPR
jgi:hypothetical protein